MTEFRKTSPLMVTKVGVGLGPLMTPCDKAGRVAVLSASLLTLMAISCMSLGLWRVGTDIEWTRAFVIPKGFLSHWQVWIGAAVAMQYASGRLVRSAGKPGRRDVEPAPTA